jgi:YggT family protein
MKVLCYLLTIYWVILFIRILSSWFPPPMSGPLRTIWRLLYDLTDPVLRPLRTMIPPIRMGGMAMDLSPIVVFVIIGVLQRVTCR